jgi:thymidylate kinase/thiamine kinase-like enzyme
MEQLFEELGYQISTDEGSKALTVIRINNPDGSIRWVLPVKAKKPYFLKFYAVTSWRSQLIALGFKLIFLLKLQLIFFKTKSISLKAAVEEGHDLDLGTNQEWALFTGTKGPNNKKILYTYSRGRSQFTKFTSSFNGVKLIQNESEGIRHLEENQVSSFIYPRVSLNTGIALTLSDISSNSHRSHVFSDSHVLALKELSGSRPYDNQECVRKKINRAALSLDNLIANRDKRIPASLLRKLKILLVNSKENDLELSFAHGDFTPWNSFYKDGKLSIYDWELSGFNVLGFDFFHFLFQHGVMVKHQDWSTIYTSIKIAASASFFKAQLPSIAKDVDQYLYAYIVFSAIECLEMFSKQRKWHAQVNWLISIWSQATSSFVSSYMEERKVLLIDSFEFLEQTKYAGIKLPTIAPEFYSEESDIDLCIQKHDAYGLLNFLKQHPLVAKIISVKKSNMLSAKAILKNGQQLDFDMVWQFRIKNLHIMSFDFLIKDRVRNENGIYTLSPANTARYVGMFYGMNDALVPNTYKNLLLNLKDSTSILDRIILQAGLDNEIPKWKLLVFTHSNKANSGIKYFLNYLSYIKDTLLLFAQNKGRVITFSGVDGAGKTTVIETLKYSLEKRYRRRVVVLRHRPSLLPILSVWTKGKEQAQKDVANVLPRTGGNNSRLGSLLRFSYYYLDYIFGQFYVYFRYVRMGVIVLYDRYYFDFINDGKRSNINLPASLIKPGYKLLMKPHLNFFLYADPQAILARKQELSAEDITQLTKKYLMLFGELAKDCKNRYYSIENNDLGTTMSFIEDKTAISILK